MQQNKNRRKVSFSSATPLSHREIDSQSIVLMNDPTTHSNMSPDNIGQDVQVVWGAAFFTAH